MCKYSTFPGSPLAHGLNVGTGPVMSRGDSGANECAFCQLENIDCSTLISTSVYCGVNHQTEPNRTEQHLRAETITENAPEVAGSIPGSS